MKSLNRSRQRDAICAYLMNTDEHPTAETIYRHVKEQYPKISLGTVYRNLALLEEIGEVQRIPSADSREHYDGNTSDHPHFQCRCCGRVIDLPMDNLDFLRTLAAGSVEGEIDKTMLLFFGLCKNCKENNNNS